MRKETLKIVIVGHVDHGKSTLIGRLLFDTHSLPKEKYAEVERISKELGSDGKLAYLTDQLKEEREKNISIDTTQIFFKTQKRSYVIIDAPGHVEFIKNMITGASLACAAVLIVDVKEGIMEQSRRHAYIIKMLGIDKVIVVLNKMDLIDYEEERFNSIKAELLNFLENLRVTPSFIVPISAKAGINISKKFSKLNWCKEPTLLQALDSLKLDKKTAKKALRFSVQDVYVINDEKLIVGRIASGVVKQGQRALLLPPLKEVTIKSIKVFGKRKKTAQEGENIGLILCESLPIRRGEVIVQRENPPKPAVRFRGNIFWMSGEPLQLDKRITLRCATQEVECIVEKIEKRINSSTLEIIEEDAKNLELNEAGEVILRAEKPIVLEKFSFIEELGRFVLERGHNLQGAGIVREKLPLLNEGVLE